MGAETAGTGPDGILELRDKPEHLTPADVGGRAVDLCLNGDADKLIAVYGEGIACGDIRYPFTQYRSLRRLLEENINLIPFEPDGTIEVLNHNGATNRKAE